MNAKLYLRPLALALSTAGLLSACGSGGGGGGADSPPATTTPTTPTTPVTGITLAGVVAKGAALANANVVVTCATGTGTATTAANGSYSLTIASGALPCVLRATSSDNATRLHSVAPASTSTSTTVTANVTPLTELVVARLSGSEPATFVANATAATLTATATASAVTAAQASVASTLTAGGVNTSSAGDFISGPLVAASGSTTGNAYDLVLDALNARLVSAGTTLAALTTTIAAGGAATVGGTATADTATLPADLLLKPKAANCASLASGSYRLIKFAPSSTTTTTTTVTAVETIDFDAPTLTYRLAGTQTVVATLVPNGNCRFSIGTDVDAVVSPAGVIVSRSFIGFDDDTVAQSARGSTRIIVGLPVQNVSVADLAGNWNNAGWERVPANTFFGPSGLNFTVAASGAVTQAKCDDSTVSTPESACTTTTTLLPVFSVNAAGGYNVTSTNPAEVWTDRAFAYRAGNGELLLALLSADGSFSFSTKSRTLTLPAAGTLTANWSVDVRVTNLASDPLYYRTHTVASVNTAAGTLLRNTANDGSTVTVPQTLEYNVARNGYLHRPGGTVTASNNTPATVREMWALPLRGFGLTAYYLPATSGTGASANAVFGISVAKQP